MAYIKASLCMEDFMEALKKYRTFKKSDKNGKHYTPITIWVNAEEKFGHDVSIQLDIPEDHPQKPEKTIYIGNGATERLLREKKQEKEQVEQKMYSATVKNNGNEVFEEATIVPICDDLPF